MSPPPPQIRYHSELQIEFFRLYGIRQSFPPHFHRGYTLGTAEQGSCPIYCSKRSYHLKPGWLFLLNPGDIHACCGGNNPSLIYCGIRLAPKVIHQWIFSSDSFGEMPYFTHPLLDSPIQASLLRQCVTQGLSSPYASSTLEDTLQKLFALLRKDHYTAPLCSLPPSFCRILRLMGQQPYRLTLHDLASQAGMSISSIERLFSRYVGMSPHRYLLNMRLESAQQLLRQGISPANVAQQVGLADQSHLYKAFSRHTGLCPGLYRPTNHV